MSGRFRFEIREGETVRFILPEEPVRFAHQFPDKSERRMPKQDGTGRIPVDISEVPVSWDQNGFESDFPVIKAVFTEPSDEAMSRAVGYGKNPAEAIPRLFQNWQLVEAAARMGVLPWRHELHITQTGRILTEADIEGLSLEAEQGYDVEHLVERARPHSGEADR
jgi:hypothetical protein